MGGWLDDDFSVTDHHAGFIFGGKQNVLLSLRNGGKC